MCVGHHAGTFGRYVWDYSTACRGELAREHAAVDLGVGLDERHTLRPMRHDFIGKVLKNVAPVDETSMYASRSGPGPSGRGLWL